MKEKVIYICDYCGQEYRSKDSVAQCEAKCWEKKAWAEANKPRFEAGDIVGCGYTIGEIGKVEVVRTPDGLLRYAYCSDCHSDEESELTLILSRDEYNSTIAELEKDGGRDFEFDPDTAAIRYTKTYTHPEILEYIRNQNYAGEGMNCDNRN